MKDDWDKGDKLSVIIGFLFILLMLTLTMCS